MPVVDPPEPTVPHRTPTSHHRGAARPRAATALVVALAVVALTGCSGGTDTATTGTSSAATAPAGAVTVYTGRHYGIEQVFAAFTAQTGIPVAFQTGKDPELRERLAAEGATTRADLLMTADAGNLALAADAGLLRRTDSPAVTAAVPADLRDAEGRWTALSRRARTVVYSPERVAADQVPAGYEALADPRWKGRLCLRPATSPYTQSLVAAMIANQGEARAEQIVRGWMANEPTFIDSDTKILEAIDAGQCDVGITNSYYLARMLGDRPDVRVRIAWPPQVHVNVSGAGVTTHAPNPDEARVLLEWLAGPGQKAFADANHEYPAATGVEPTAVLVGFGPLTADPLPVARFGELQPAAVDLLERTGHA